jgi:hypothetical protein
LAVYRRSECYIYAPRLPMRTKAEGVKLPKLLVELSPRDLRYGLYIEKSDAAMDDSWYWPLLPGAAGRGALAAEPRARHGPARSCTWRVDDGTARR